MGDRGTFIDYYVVNTLPLGPTWSDKFTTLAVATNRVAPNYSVTGLMYKCRVTRAPFFITRAGYRSPAISVVLVTELPKTEQNTK